jgi:hypothetical protein
MSEPQANQVRLGVRQGKADDAMVGGAALGSHRR